MRFATAIRAGLACLLLVGAGCSAPSSEPTEHNRRTGRDAGEKPVPVEAVPLEVGEIEASLRFSANVEAERQVAVVSRATGQVTKLTVEEGARVKSDHVLLRLEDEEPRSRLARAQHDLANAKREFEQHQRAHAEGIDSDQVLEQARYELERVRLLADDARRQVRYTVVKSPIAGTITQRFVEFGDQIAVGQQLFEVTDFNSIVARIYVPEKSLGALAPGLDARVTAQVAGSETVVGKVDRVAPVVDPKSGTIKVTVAIPADSTLRPGMFVNVELVTEQRAVALLLPKRALVYDNDEPYAFVIDGDHAVKRRVVVALEDRTNVQPASGFKAGDRVVIAGQVGLKNGALVDAKPPPAQRPNDKTATP